MTGNAANISESKISWTDRGFQAAIDRYTGQMIFIAPNVRPVFGKCIKASEKKF
jgi:hypothetical protein